MTGRIIGAADCLMLGLAGAMVPSDSIGDLRAALLACDVPDRSVIDRFRADPGMLPLQAHRAAISHVFAGDDLAAMRERAGDLARLKAILRRGCSRRDGDEMPGKHACVQTPSRHGGPDRGHRRRAELDYRLAIRMTERPISARGCGRC